MISYPAECVSGIISSIMEEIILEILGPYYGLALASGGLFAWWPRESIRRKHLLIFFGIGALAGTSFYFLVLILVFGGNRVTHPNLAMFGLYASAAIGTAAAGATLLGMFLIPRNDK